jgi:hypothetical protein
MDLNLQRSGRILIIREREKKERAETARSGPSSARPAQLDCTRALTKKIHALKFVLQENQPMHDAYSQYSMESAREGRGLTVGSSWVAEATQGTAGCRAKGLHGRLRRSGGLRSTVRSRESAAPVT